MCKGPFNYYVRVSVGFFELPIYLSKYLPTLNCPLINEYACLVHTSYVLSEHAHLLGRWEYVKYISVHNLPTPRLTPTYIL